MLVHVYSLILGACITSATPLHPYLQARQTGGDIIDPSLVPRQCQDICVSLNSATNGTCGFFDCFCGTNYSKTVSGCLQCMLDVVQQPSFISECQSIYDNYASSCKSAGDPVPTVTFKLDSSSNGAGTAGAGDSLPASPTNTPIVVSALPTPSIPTTTALNTGAALPTFSVIPIATPTFSPVTVQANVALPAVSLDWVMGTLLPVVVLAMLSGGCG
ncbi:hypothetical protein NP233_g484 [Leucocoprinus birnbaumii]|uniref:Extracellular membrane protein CFEM domain-containing protein n=1 Tax=Leucocoprinus birnbaumii TaxID=56174 RepID=A0AAD5W6T6_9AGAR|nr:hypothetical protein NP233_g484 [Leucocoprinus birnbaumii]